MCATGISFDVDQTEALVAVSRTAIIIFSVCVCPCGRDCDTTAYKTVMNYVLAANREWLERWLIVLEV